MNQILEEIFKASGHLIIAGMVCTAFNIASEQARNHKYKVVLWKGLLWCAGIALFASITLGNPTCETQSDDRLYGHCEQYANDGYIPTTEQMVASFSYFMTLLYIPVAIGAFRQR